MSEKLTHQLEVGLTDEVYDGGMGALSETELSQYIRNLAVKAEEVVQEWKDHVLASMPFTLEKRGDVWVVQDKDSPGCHPAGPTTIALREALVDPA